MTIDEYSSDVAWEGLRRPLLLHNNPPSLTNGDLLHQIVRTASSLNGVGDKASGLLVPVSFRVTHKILSVSMQWR